MPAAIDAALTFWAVAVAVADWRWQRIPNALLLLVVVPAAVLAVAGRPGLAGATTLAAVSGSALSAMLFLPGYLLRGVGAGDVKLAIVGGWVLGLPRALEWILLGAAVLGAAALVRAGMQRFRLQGFADRDAVRRPLPVAPCLMPVFILELLASPLLLRGG